MRPWILAKGQSWLTTHAAALRVWLVVGIGTRIVRRCARAALRLIVRARPPMLSRHPFLRGLVDLVREVLERYGRLGGSQFAAAISYRALFSLVPLATFVATILAQVLSSSHVDRHDLVPAIADQLDLSPAERPSSTR